MKRYRRVGLIPVCLLLNFGVALSAYAVANAQQRDYADVELALLQSLREAETLGPASLPLAQALFKLGLFYRTAANVADAERFYLRSLSVYEKVLGTDDPRLAEPLNGLVSLYLEEGLHWRAARLHSRIVAVSRGLRPTDPAASLLVHQLAAIYFLQRQYSKAETLYRQVLSDLDRSSPESAQTVAVLNNLAILCGKKARYEEAASYLRKALAVGEKALAPDNPYVARTLSNLAGIYVAQGLYSDAEPLFQRALHIAGNSLGAENLLVARILAEYAVLLRKTKRKDAAKSMEKRARSIRESHGEQDVSRHTIDVDSLRNDRNGKP